MAEICPERPQAASGTRYADRAAKGWAGRQRRPLEGAEERRTAGQSLLTWPTLSERNEPQASEASLGAALQAEHRRGRSGISRQSLRTVCPAEPARLASRAVDVGAADRPRWPALPACPALGSLHAVQAA